MPLIQDKEKEEEPKAAKRPLVGLTCALVLGWFIALHFHCLLSLQSNERFYDGSSSVHSKGDSLLPHRSVFQLNSMAGSDGNKLHHVLRHWSVGRNPGSCGCVLLDHEKETRVAS